MVTASPKMSAEEAIRTLPQLAILAADYGTQIVAAIESAESQWSELSKCAQCEDHAAALLTETREAIARLHCFLGRVLEQLPS